jgi:hypothetical protein
MAATEAGDKKQLRQKGTERESRRGELETKNMAAGMAAGNAGADSMRWAVSGFLAQNEDSGIALSTGGGSTRANHRGNGGDQLHGGERFAMGNGGENQEC